jgi:glycosyltransferase involved in cell wall biosynthesis
VTENNRIHVVSVVIPCKNEENYILRCIKSVLNSDYKTENLEVLVCDGKSDDSTAEIVQAEAEKNPGVKYLLNDHETTPFGLNLGINHASGDVIVILGAHAEISSDYIKGCVEVLDQKSDVWCTGGLLENICEDNITTNIALAMSSPFGVGNVHFRTGEKDGYVDTVAFGAYRREVFEKIGLFDEELTRNQDDEFNFRILKNGGKIWLTTSTHVVYYVRSSYGKLLKQYFQYGYWKVLVNRKHKTVTTFRQLVPSAFVMGLLLGIIGSVVYKIGWMLLVFILASYLVMSLIFAISRGSGAKQTLGIILAFMILHLGYGTGYLRGIVDFLMLRRKPSAQQTRITR